MYRPRVGCTYYVDNAGSDSNSGRTPALAWQTVAKVNAATPAPGQGICFKRAGLWREEITATASGASGSPVLYDAYGAGTNPIISGANLIGGTWLQYVSADAWNTATNLTSDGQFTDNAQRNFRSVLPASVSAVDGTKIRITLVGATTGTSSVVSAATIGPMTTNDVFDSAPTVITFNGGATTATIANSAVQVSDDITFTFSKTQRYGIHLWFLRDLKFFSVSNSQHLYSYTTTASSVATTLAPTGPTIFNETMVGKFEVFATGASQPGVWYQATTDPVYIYENGLYLSAQTTIPAVIAAAGSKYWDATNLYIHTLAGGNPNSNGLVYEKPVRTETFDDMGKNWIKYQNVDSVFTNGSGSTIGGVKFSGSNSVMQNFTTHDHGRHCWGFAAITSPGPSNDLAYNITGYNSHTTTVAAVFGNQLTGATHDNTVRNCWFRNDQSINGNAGIVMHGKAANTLITGCEFAGARANSGQVIAYDTGTTGVRVTNSYFHGPAGAAAGAAIFWTNAGTGGMDHGSSDHNTIDMTGDTINQTANGAIRVMGVANCSSYHDTVYGYTTNALTSGIRLNAAAASFTAEDDIFYNVAQFINADADSISGLVFDYNSYFANTGVFGTWAGVTKSTFALWKTASSTDAHSLNSNPLMVNPPTDVTLQAGSPAIGAGLFVAGVSTANPPNIGAK
jgi:hypothetical protein